MADTKLSALVALAATPAVDDEVYIRDISELAAAESKRITIANIFNSPALTTPALGTPASGVMTNVTGTAAGLTAGNVTTNANLTGVVTSAGNATAIADKALAIAKLADGTDGELITWSATGVIATVAVGTATHVLTSNGVGVAPTFQAAAGGLTFTELSGKQRYAAVGVAWEDWDISALVPVGTKYVEVLIFNRNAGTFYHGVRANGSVLDRTQQGCTGYNSVSVTTPVDANRIIEVICDTNVLYAWFGILGYWS